VTHKSIGGQKWAYYNEIDPYAAEWLRSLIRSGHIANGIVDERSISDVRPDELQEFTQCHFFAGIGVWSYALRSAGWEDDRPVWTGSCPCQPFSNAGSRKGITDERHLWPHWFHLIEQCRPSTVFGEQVASKDGLGWIDLVQADMEGEDYAIGSFDLCSAGFGAPHIRQRLWFVADTDNARSQGRISGRTDSKWQDKHGHVGCNGSTIGMGNADNSGSQGGGKARVGQELEQSGAQFTRTRADVGMGDPDIDDGRNEHSTVTSEREARLEHGSASATGGMDQGRSGKTNGHWSDADWLRCRDGKWRPVEPDTFPLAHGATARVGRLRAYGNAITAQVAQGLIESYMEVKDG